MSEHNSFLSSQAGLNPLVLMLMQLLAGSEAPAAALQTGTGTPGFGGTGAGVQRPPGSAPFPGLGGGFGMGPFGPGGTPLPGIPGTPPGPAPFVPVGPGSAPPPAGFDTGLPTGPVLAGTSPPAFAPPPSPVPQPADVPPQTPPPGPTGLEPALLAGEAPDPLQELMRLLGGFGIQQAGRVGGLSRDRASANPGRRPRRSRSRG